MSDSSDQMNSDTAGQAACKTSGETELDTLIASMQPVLHDEVFVFAQCPHNIDLSGVVPQMQFQEREALSLIVTEKEAESLAVDYTFRCKMITLNVHSSLDAIGFLARITTELASHGMSVNPVSGFYHDHLFVPIERADDAFTALRLLSAAK